MNDTGITLSREDAELILVRLNNARNAVKTVNPTLGSRLAECYQTLLSAMEPGEPDGGEEAAQETEPDTADLYEGIDAEPAETNAVPDPGATVEAETNTTSEPEGENVESQDESDEPEGSDDESTEEDTEETVSQ